MGIARSSEIDDYLDDADDMDGMDLERLIEDRKTRRAAGPRNRHGRWRDLEEYLEARRLKQSLTEYYDEDDPA